MTLRTTFPFSGDHVSDHLAIHKAFNAQVWTADYTYIQDAIDALYAGDGAGIVNIGPGTFEEQITLPVGILLSGAGHNATIIKLPDGTNDHLIKSVNFATLTGSNNYLVADGVPHGFGLINLSLDGNRANNTGGNAIAIYGKRYLLQNVLIRDAVGDGLYSECGNSGGGNSYIDMPESSIGPLWVFGCGGVGVNFKGPHDAHLVELSVGGCDGDGVVLGYGAAYSGICDIGMIHAYDCDRGFVAEAGAKFRAYLIIGESCHQEGINIACGSAQAAMMRAYANNRTSGSHSVLVSGDSNHFQSVSINTANGAAAINDTGTGNLIVASVDGGAFAAL